MQDQVLPCGGGTNAAAAPISARSCMLAACCYLCCAPRADAAFPVLRVREPIRLQYAMQRSPARVIE